MNAHEVLATHKISIKSIRRANGTVDKYYSIQFTYPQGTKRQFTGNSEDEVKNKVFQFFNVPLITFRELHEKLLLDTKSEHLKKTSIKRFLEALGSKPAVAVTSDDILIGKQVLAEGFKSSTANNQIVKISWMYDYGIEKGLVDINPAKDIKRFRKQEVAFEQN